MGIPYGFCPDENIFNGSSQWAAVGFIVSCFVTPKTIAEFVIMGILVLISVRTPKTPRPNT